MWEGLKSRSYQRCAGITRCVQLDYLFKSSYKLLKCVFMGAVFQKNKITKGKLCKITAHTSEKEGGELDEKTMKKMKQHMVKNMLMRMIFNDGAEENFGNNVRTSRQLGEMKKRKVRDFVYVLDTAITGGNGNVRPLKYIKGGKDRDVVVRVEGVYDEDIHGFDRTGNSRIFQYSASDDDDDDRDRKDEEGGTNGLGEEGTGRHQISPFNPTGKNRDLVNNDDYVEETWRYRTGLTPTTNKILPKELQTPDRSAQKASYI